MSNQKLRSSNGSIAVTALVLAACSLGPPPNTPGRLTVAPSAGGLDAVVYLVGDAGLASDSTPLIRSLQTDIDAARRKVPTDEHVAVLFLGDLVYEDGIRRDPVKRAADSLRLRAQALAFRGTAVRGMFLPGNHDWAQGKDPASIARLGVVLQGIASGLSVRAELAPTPAGCPGPKSIDVGERVAAIMVDTHWWLRQRDVPVPDACPYKTVGQVTDAVAAALARADGRMAIVAAHHPMRTGGEHGGYRSGLGGFAYQLGLIGQDVNATDYRNMLRDLDRAFEAHPPFIFAAGHDHNLQVIAGSGPGPRYHLVSGAGSKLTPVGPVDGLEFKSGEHEGKLGYMRLEVGQSGEVNLFVITGPRDDCSRQDLDACLAREAGKFAPVFSKALR